LLSRLLASTGNDFKNTLAVQVVKHRTELLPLEALFIDPDMGDDFVRATSKAPLHGPVHDVVDLTRRKAKKPGCSRLTLRKQKNLDGELLEQNREPRLGARPRNLDLLYSVIRTVRPRYAGHNDRSELHGVKVT